MFFSLLSHGSALLLVAFHQVQSPLKDQNQGSTPHQRVSPLVSVSVSVWALAGMVFSGELA